MKSTRAISNPPQSISQMQQNQLGKRSRSTMNFIAEGQENEEPMMKKRVSPVDDIVVPEMDGTRTSRAASATTSTVPIVSTNSTKKHPLALEIPPASSVLLLPQSLTPLIEWSREDHDVYAWSILDTKLREEQQFVFDSPVYEHVQTVVTPASHNCMFNFLCEVAQDQRLSYSTFLHAMQIFDHVLSRVPVGKTDFLVTGCACLMLVSKLEEIYPPTSDGLMAHANFVFSKAELYHTERSILELLNFKIARPTRLHFAEYLGKMHKMTKRQGALLQYLIGLSFLDFDLNYFKASVVAAAALIVTFQTTNVSRDIPSLLSKLASVINATDDDIQRCVVHLRFVHHVAQTGPDLHCSATFPTVFMKRTTQHIQSSSQSKGLSTCRPMSPQLIEWFSTEEAFFVAEVTALPLYDLDLSLVVNYSVRSPAQSANLSRSIPRTSSHSQMHSSSANNGKLAPSLSQQSLNSLLAQRQQLMNGAQRNTSLPGSTSSTSLYTAADPNAVAMAMQLGIGM